jgi:hypothetical protein
MKMLGHNLEILKELNKQNPPPPSIKGMDSSFSEGLDPSQLFDQILPDFWLELDIVAIADHNPEVVAGNSSDCQ